MFGLPRHPECGQWRANIQIQLCVCVFSAVFESTENNLQPLPPFSLVSSALLWFSCHYLLIKVENNSPALAISLMTSSTLQRFGYGGHRASAHRTSSFHLTRCWSMRDQGSSHSICCLSMCECIWGGPPPPLACNWLCLEAKSCVFTPPLSRSCSEGKSFYKSICMSS